MPGPILMPVTNLEILQDVVTRLGLNTDDPMVKDLFPRFNGYGVEALFVIKDIARYNAGAHGYSRAEALAYVASVVNHAASSGSFALFTRALERCEYDLGSVESTTLRDLVDAIKWAFEYHHDALAQMVERPSVSL
ncbi:MAG TPA: hypothetical protein VLF59_00615 [Candidatus Saccharimonadales bacterium]|nr:hypothetical protein [Candidatus Saccharimonadales bacterium]